jgi:hypothetical protein
MIAIPVSSNMALPVCGKSLASMTCSEFLSSTTFRPCSLGGLFLGHRLVDDPHDVGLLHDEEFLAVDLDFGPDHSGLARIELVARVGQARRRHLRDRRGTAVET